MEKPSLTIMFLEGEIEGRKRKRDNRIRTGETVEKEQKIRKVLITEENKIIVSMENAVNILREK